jgi:hypothetical protein
MRKHIVIKDRTSVPVELREALDAIVLTGHDCDEIWLEAHNGWRLGAFIGGYHSWLKVESPFDGLNEKVRDWLKLVAASADNKRRAGSWYDPMTG